VVLELRMAQDMDISLVLVRKLFFPQVVELVLVLGIVQVLDMELALHILLDKVL
jgi:hypothetical protein